MGGNALKEYSPRRLNSREVVNLFNHISRNWNLDENRPLYLVPWIGEKDSHGDIDIVAWGNPDKVREFLARQGIEIIKQNDKVLSVGWPLPWRGLDVGPSTIAQVDFICAPPSDWEATRFFYSGGDFGMMLGRIAAWHGLTFGMNGLRLRADHNRPWMRDVLLTSVPSSILVAMGYPARMPYFDTYVDMWRFIMSSPMAKPYMFMPEGTNAENRSRDAQRPAVGQFQQWLASIYDVTLPEGARRATCYEAIMWIDTKRSVLGWTADSVKDTLAGQEAAWSFRKEMNHRLGAGAVRRVLATHCGEGEVGPVIQAMQAFMPQGKDRKQAIIYDQLNVQRIALMAAWTAAYQMNLDVLPFAQIPQITEADRVEVPAEISEEE